MRYNERNDTNFIDFIQNGDNQPIYETQDWANSFTKPNKHVLNLQAFNQDCNY